MNENKTLQQDIAKAKIKIITSSICELIILIMEIYIMINYKGYFVAMAFGILCMVVGLFFLISGVMDVTMKTKAVEAEKYENIYNAQKASYLVIRKSFEEMDARLRSIEENSAIPAEEIISAQKAVAKVTISRSKENTDALMNSNDELINQLFTIQEKMDSSNNELLEKQQALLNATRDDLQNKISELTAQISNIEGRIGQGASMPAYQQASSQGLTNSPVQEVANDFDLDLKLSDVTEADSDLLSEEGLGVDAVEEQLMVEEPNAYEKTVITEPIEINEMMAEEPAIIEETAVDQSAMVSEELVVTEETAVDQSAMVSEESVVTEEVVVDEPVVTEEAVVDEPATAHEEDGAKILAVDDIMQSVEEIAADQAEESIHSKEEVAAEEVMEALKAPVETMEAQEASVGEPTSILTDTGVDLSDPNRVMSPEEIEKLFASL